MSVKDSYADGLCPDCGFDIPEDAPEGWECPNCGHACYEYPALNLSKLLEENTIYKGWEEADGPETGVGIDYWFECTDEDGKIHSAYINVDQTDISVSVDGDVVWQGDSSEVQS